MTRISHSLVLLLAVLLSAALISSARAQRPDRGPRPPRGPQQWRQPGENPMRLLQVEQIQKELGITESQLEKLKEIVQSARETMQEKRQALRKEAGKLREAGPEARKAHREAMREAMEGHAARMREKIAAVLEPSQLERLDQITLQLAGPAALTQAKVARKLELTEEQQQKLQELRKGMRKKMNEMFASMKGLDPKERRGKHAETAAKLKTLRDAALREVMGVLTPEQKQKFEELRGKPFELQPPKPRGFRPERRRPRGGGPDLQTGE